MKLHIAGLSIACAILICVACMCLYAQEGDPRSPRRDGMAGATDVAGRHRTGEEIRWLRGLIRLDIYCSVDSQRHA